MSAISKKWVLYTSFDMLYSAFQTWLGSSFSAGERQYGQRTHLYLRLWLKQSPRRGEHPDTSKLCTVQMTDRNFAASPSFFWSLQSTELIQLRGSFRISWLSVPLVGRHIRNHKTKPRASSPFLSQSVIYTEQELSVFSSSSFFLGCKVPGGRAGDLLRLVCRTPPHLFG